MRFRGQLLLPDDPGPGLQVDLEVADQRLAVMSEQERLGAWPLDTVQVRRVGSDTYSMSLAGEPLHFRADDTVSFAYSGIPAIERMGGSTTHARSPWRSFLRGLGLDSDTGDRADMDLGHRPPGAVVEVPESDRGEDETATVEVHTETVPEDGPAPDEVPAGPPPASLIDITDAGSVTVAEGAEEDLPAATQHAWDDPVRPEASPGEERQNEVPGAKEETGCPARRADGQPCRSPIIGPSGYCFPHDPDRPEGDEFRKAMEARARLKEKGAARLNRVYSRLDRALRQVEQGKLDPDKAMAMAQLARTMCAILELDEDQLEDEKGSSEPGFWHR